MQKIKQWIESEGGKDILIVCIVILVGLGSFLLGRLSKSGGSSGIKIEYPKENLENVLPANVISTTSSKPKIITPTPPVQTIQNPPATVKNFFASSRGNKYYSIGCSAGKTIKLENRVYFATSAEAEAAGYELSRGCK